MFLTGFPSVPPGLVTISQSVCPQTDNQPLISTQCHGCSLPSSTRQPRYIKVRFRGEEEVAGFLAALYLREVLWIVGLEMCSLFSNSDLIEPLGGTASVRVTCEHAAQMLTTKATGSISIEVK